MLFVGDGVVGAVGAYHFKDGRDVPYIDWVDGQGGGVFRVSVPDGVATPATLDRGVAHLELRRKEDGRMSLRLLGFQAELSQLHEAA